MRFAFVLFSSFALTHFAKPSFPVTLSKDKVPFDSLRSVRFLNNSSIQQLPSIVKDLSAALDQSTFKSKGLLDNDKLAIYLYDVYSKRFDTSAAVRYQPDNHMYYLKINSLNKNATDKALAVTLIHELMHCILMDIDKNARKGDRGALAMVKDFDSIVNRRSPGAPYSFFMLMNTGESGQHELMFRLFFKDMILLLKQFASLHNTVFFDAKEPEYLLWSGLQHTREYQKLSYDQRREIEISIFQAKGIAVSDE